MADPQPSNPILPASGFTTIGNELDQTAPLWRVYRDEVRDHDRDVTLDEWNKTLDVLLIFAGLFSAVITGFLVASYPLLNPEDENEDVVNAIHALAMAINSSITLPTPKPQEPVTASILWVNGLWFASLFIALAVAFFAILAKQWLVEYNHRMADPPAAVAASLTERNDHATVASPTRTADPEANVAPASTTLSLTAPTADPEAPKLPSASNGLSPTASLAWARRRQFFFSAFESWHVPALITQVLPFLLHVALFLFLVGLSVFVWTLNKRIAHGMTVLTAFLFFLYLTATLLPVLRVECPTATPLVRRAREAPIWISIKAVQLWHSILPTALTAFDLSPAALERVITDLSQRQKNIRDSGWLEGGTTTDDDVKLATLWWLIFVSGSETAVTAAFQAVGALPADSAILTDIKKLTASMDTAVERLGNSLTPPTAIEIIRAVRSELVLGRGSWDLPLLGLDLSPLHTKTLQESQHPEARLLSAAMHLDGTLYDLRTRTTGARSFSSLYNITDALLRGNRNPDSCLSTARLLLNLPGITVAAFGCLSVILARSLHVDHTDKELIFRIFNLLPKRRPCDVYGEPHKCNGLCVAVFVVLELNMLDPASLRISPIILSHLLPCLMPELKSGNEDLVPLSISREQSFFRAISRSDWLRSPPPAGDIDVDVLLTLLSRYNWSDYIARDAYLQTLKWFMFRGLYGALRSPSLIAEVQDTRTCGADKRPAMLWEFRRIVHGIKINPNKGSTTDNNERLREFISSLISLCRDLLQCSDELSLDLLFKEGLIPELVACIDRMHREVRIYNQHDELIDMVDLALEALDGQVDDKEEYLLHVAQHCVELDRKWTQREAVLTHLDRRLLEKRLVEQGPCTKCTEGSADKWPDGFFDLVRAQSPTVEQDPQPDPPPAAPSTSLAASAPAVLPLTAYPPNVASPNVASASSAPDAISVFRVESGTMPILQAATGSGHIAPDGSHPVIASLSVPPGYSVLVSASSSTAVLDPPSGTTPSLVIVPSAPTTATSTVPTRADVRAAEVSPVAVLDAIGTLVVSQTEPATRDDADFAHDPPSAAETATSGDEEPVILAPRVAGSSPAEPVAAGTVTLVASSAAPGVSPVSAHDLHAVSAATSRSVTESGTDAAAIAVTISLPYPPAAPAQVGTASASLSGAAEDVEVAAASSVE